MEGTGSMGGTGVESGQVWERRYFVLQAGLLYFYSDQVGVQIT
jgi:hypothetical protein